MIHYDTRKIKPSDVFLAIDKGSNYITPTLLETISQIIKLSKQEVFCYLSKYWNLDLNKVKIIGVTGTNGKTTTTYLVKQILEHSGKKCRLLGTITNSLTTPEMYDILEVIKEMIDNKEEYLVMEVSSIGVVENRIYGLPFTVKCLTNITQDHLDYHKTFKNYAESKFQFLRLPGPTIFPKDYKKLRIDFKTNLHGKFNKFNMQAAYAICLEIGLSEDQIKAGLAIAKEPKGRFQLVENNLPFQVFVDYAHTPDGILNILKAAKEMNPKKIIIVFGAGGNRDTTKRPLMGQIANEYSDFSIITTDNPRHENPVDIINGIVKGYKNNNYKIIEDRSNAIKEAISMASTGDIVLIAGKGHEDYQIIGDIKHHFDDFEEARKCLRERFKNVHTR